MQRASLLLVVVSLAAPPLLAQATSSPTFFLPSHARAAGGAVTSVTYRLSAAQGAGVVASRATSASFVLRGGVVGTFDVSTTGAPWATAVRPLFAPLNGGTALAVHGTQLALGTGTGVKIGGKDARVTARTHDRVNVVMPAQDAPGWQPVRVTAGGGTSELVKGLGVLPMLELDRPAEFLQPLSIGYRGFAGDIVVWMFSFTKGPFPIKLPGYGHAFELNLLSLFMLTATPVLSPDGKTQLPLPAFGWPRGLAFQGLVLSQNSGYRPGSFTNLVEL